MSDTIKSAFDVATCVAGLTRTERSVVLYAESVCVDYKGQMDTRRLNTADIDVLHKCDGILWTYIPSQSVVEMTPDGWAVAHTLRRQRGERNSLLQNTTPAVTA